MQTLSGGNQQKVVVAKWLETDARVLFFDEPARGIDVGTKAELFKLLGALAQDGRGIVLISSYLPELINLCDRVLVLRDGAIAGELAARRAVGGADRRAGDRRTDGGGGMNIRARMNDVLSQVAAAAALIVVVIALSIASPYFLTTNNLFNVCVQIAVIAIIAVGQTMVIITAGIDLSVGSVAGLSGVMGTMAMSSWGMPIVVGILVGVLIGALAGAVNGLLITQAKLPPFIATLGMMGVARGLTFIVSGSVAIYGLSGAFRNVGEGQIGPIPLPLLYMIVIGVLGHLTLSRTRLGRYAYAIGSNPDAARLSGISTTRVLIGVYVICAALAGFGGMIAASRVHSGQPNYGIGLELDVIAACVIGGASLFGGQGTIGGTIIGALLMGVIRNGAVLLEHHAVLPDGRHRGDHLDGRLVGPAAAVAHGRGERALRGEG